jgi:hypothetical protein
LHHDRDASGQFTRWKTPDVRAVHVDRASAEVDASQQRADERTLPAAVRAHDRRKGAARGLEGDPT